MAQDAIYPGTAIPEIKSARGQIALSIPPSGIESTHLARATRGLDGPFLPHLYRPLLSIQQDITLRETHQDSSFGSAYKVITVGTNKVKLLECKRAAPCRRGCSALVFLVPSLLLCSLQEHNHLSEVQTHVHLSASCLRQLLLTAFRGRVQEEGKYSIITFPLQPPSSLWIWDFPNQRQYLQLCL